MKLFIFCIVVALGSFIPLSQSFADGYSNTSEASTVITGGNTDLRVFNVKTENIYKKTKNRFLIGGHYTYGTNERELSARNWQVRLRYDREIKDKLGAFGAYDYEQDKFRGFIYRQNWDLGLSYKLFSSDRQSLSLEGGYRFTREKDVLGNRADDFQKSRYAALYEYKAAKNWSFRSKKELLLNHTETSDTIFTIEPSLNMVLTDRVSFKFAYKGIYENQPSSEGLKKYDYQITSGLIAKF